jgi:hypothetical protein
MSYCRSKTRHRKVRQVSSLSVPGGIDSGDRLISETTPLLRNRSTSTETTPLLTNSNILVIPEVEVHEIVHKKSPSLLRTLFVVFGPLMAQGHLCKLFGDAMMFVGPMIQR